MRLELHARTDLAITLIRRGMRTSIVHQITGVQMVRLRQLHHEIHCRKPASGQLPTSYGVLRTHLMQAYASAFASLYRSLASGDVQSALDTQALIKAHDLYLEQVSDVPSSGGQGDRFDVNQAWTIARDLTTGVVRFQFCQRCRVHYTVVDLSARPLTCPLCALKRGGKPQSLRNRVADVVSPEDHVTSGATCRLRQEGGRT